MCYGISLKTCCVACICIFIDYSWAHACNDLRHKNKSHTLINFKLFFFARAIIVFYFSHQFRPWILIKTRWADSIQISLNLFWYFKSRREMCSAKGISTLYNWNYCYNPSLEFKSKIRFIQKKLVMIKWQ